MKGPSAIIVDSFSAGHSRPWENDSYNIQPMNRTHSELVKFSNHDNDYERVLAVLRRYAENAVRVLPRSSRNSAAGNEDLGLKINPSIASNTAPRRPSLLESGLGPHSRAVSKRASKAYGRTKASTPRTLRYFEECALERTRLRRDFVNLKLQIKSCGSALYVAC